MNFSDPGPQDAQNNTEKQNGIDNPGVSTYDSSAMHIGPQSQRYEIELNENTNLDDIYDRSDNAYDLPDNAYERYD